MVRVALFSFSLIVFSSSLWASEVASPAEGDPGSSRDPTTEKYSSVANKCGVQYQNQFNHPVGVPHCGEAVADMIECMAKSEGIDCHAYCGNGRDFNVAGCNDKMTKCGYKSVDVTSELCRKPGAVLSYYDSGTPNGKKFGHVEFACGDNLFCSVYKAPIEGNWKYGGHGEHETPTTCWFPAKNGKVPDAGKIPPGSTAPGSTVPGDGGGGGHAGSGGGSANPAPSLNPGSGGGTAPSVGGFNGGGGGGGGAPSFSPSSSGGSAGGGGQAAQMLMPTLAGAAIGYLAYKANHPPAPVPQQYMVVNRPGAPPLLVPINAYGAPVNSWATLPGGYAYLQSGAYPYGATTSYPYGTATPYPYSPTAPYAQVPGYSSAYPYPYGINYSGTTAAPTPTYLSNGQYMYLPAQYTVLSVGGR